MNKKIATSIIILTTLGVMALLFLSSRPTQLSPRISKIKTEPKITINTNKNIYAIGENINITVKNGLNRDVFYSQEGKSFWNIEYYENEKWNQYGYKGRESFQLTDNAINEDCYIVLYEQAPPILLESQSNLSTSWNQITCPFNDNYGNPSKAQYITSGEHRLSFRYGFELYNNGQLISEPKIIYSNIFTIK